MHFYRTTESGDFRERVVQVLDLILPAFKADTYSWLEMLTRHTDLESFYESFVDGVLLAEIGGTVVHESARLRSTLASDPEGAFIHRAMLGAAAATGAAGRRTLTQRRRWRDDRLLRSYETTSDAISVVGPPSIRADMARLLLRGQRVRVVRAAAAALTRSLEPRLASCLPLVVGCAHFVLAPEYASRLSLRQSHRATVDSLAL